MPWPVPADDHPARRLPGLRFENDLREGLRGGVRDAQRDVPDAEALGDLLRLAGQCQRRPPAFLAHDFHIHPSDAACPARAERLHGGFLGGEAPRVALILVLETLAIGDFCGSVNPPQKSFAAPLDGGPHAVHFSYVNTEPGDHGGAHEAACFPLQRGSPIILFLVPKNKKRNKKTKPARRKSTQARALPRRKPVRPRVVVWTTRTLAGVRVLQARSLSNLPWLAHGFSTRPGGASDFNSERVLNLGFMEWDTRENVIENRKRLQCAANAQDFALVSVKQTHSDVIHIVRDAPGALPPGPGQEPPRADASVTNRPGILLAVQTADCVPILLADPRNGAVAAVHAGWRGTLQRIAAKTIGQMQMQFGSRPDEIFAAIGPAIGGCCYEVGTEVAAAFHAQFEQAADWFDELRTGYEPNPLQWLNQMPPGHQPPPKNVLLDLKKANRAQLLSAGLHAENISLSDLCTACRRDLFFSYRKEGAASGRMMAVIGIRHNA